MGPHETAYLGLGSNEGNRVSSLAEAVRRIGNLRGTRVLEVSPLYETSPVDVAGDFFLNAVVVIETAKDPRDLLVDLQDIEYDMGRIRRTPGREPRNIDIDLLLYGERVVTEPGLELPHPRMIERRFVLEPLADLAPDLRIPGEEHTVSQMAAGLRERFPDQVVSRTGRFKREHQIK